MSIVAVSYMVGCMTDSTGGAIFAGIGLWMTWLILDQIESLGRIRNILPTHYSGDWAFIFTSGTWSNDLWRCALLTLGYVVVFVSVRRVVVPPQGHPELSSPVRPDPSPPEPPADDAVAGSVALDVDADDRGGADRRRRSRRCLGAAEFVSTRCVLTALRSPAATPATRRGATSSSPDASCPVRCSP